MDFPIPIDRIASGEVKDSTLRSVIRFGLTRLLKTLSQSDFEAELATLLRWVHELRASPIAVGTDAANAQHYEVPAELFGLMLGKHRKYSSCYFPDATTDLDTAETAMLELVCKRADVRDGQAILDLGCGWGALSLYLAERYPRSRIYALSSSRSQKDYIDSQAVMRNLGNLEVMTCDIADWQPALRFDRIVSIEMLEHLRNYELLFEKLRAWLRPDGKLFVHIFCHKSYAYPFTRGFIADHFFTGGQMPAENLLLYFQKDLQLVEQWRVLGKHYQRTAEEWLLRLDRNRDAALALFRRDASEEEPLRTFVKWRLFLLTCAESFGFREGTEWFVAHYLFRARE